MRRMIISLAFTLVAAVALAKPPAPQSPEKATRTFTSSAEVTALIANPPSAVLSTFQVMAVREVILFVCERFEARRCLLEMCV
jgi:hypothetical protein